MRHFRANRAWKLAIIGVVGTLLCQPLLAAEATINEKAYNPAKNLARMNCGAHIECVSSTGRITAVPIVGEHNQSPAALVWDDNTLSCPLPEGDITFVVTLPKITLLDRFAFINENAAARGEFQFAVSNYRLSPNDSRWIPVEGSKRLTGNREVNLSILGVEARYVKLSFHIEKEGRLAGIGLYGEPTLQSFAEQHDARVQSAYMVPSTRSARRLEDTLNFNFANLYASARVVYVSSGLLPLARRMIDDDAMTAFSFSASDARPTAIIEFAKSQRLHRVGASYQMEGGRLDVYLLNDLNGSSANLENLRPVASIVDPVGGKAAVDFDPQGARYVALRWTRNKSRGGPFEVAEIGAFSVVPLSLLDISQFPAAFADGSIHFPGEGGLDFSNGLGTLAEPPVVASVSP
jgi:hypothetical protein